MREFQALWTQRPKSHWNSELGPVLHHLLRLTRKLTADIWTPSASNTSVNIWAGLASAGWKNSYKPDRTPSRCMLHSHNANQLPVGAAVGSSRLICQVNAPHDPLDSGAGDSPDLQALDGCGAHGFAWLVLGTRPESLWQGWTSLSLIVVIWWPEKRTSTTGMLLTKFCLCIVYIKIYMYADMCQPFCFLLSFVLRLPAKPRAVLENTCV